MQQPQFHPLLSWKMWVTALRAFFSINNLYGEASLVIAMENICYFTQSFVNSSCLLGMKEKKYLKGNVENALENTRSLKQKSRAEESKDTHSR